MAASSLITKEHMIKQESDCMCLFIYIWHMIFILILNSELHSEQQWLLWPPWPLWPQHHWPPLSSEPHHHLLLPQLDWTGHMQGWECPYELQKSENNRGIELFFFHLSLFIFYSKSCWDKGLIVFSSHYAPVTWIHI